MVFSTRNINRKSKQNQWFLRKLKSRKPFQTVLRRRPYISCLNRSDISKFVQTVANRFAKIVENVVAKPSNRTAPPRLSAKASKRAVPSPAIVNLATCFIVGPSYFSNIAPVQNALLHRFQLRTGVKEQSRRAMVMQYSLARTTGIQLGDGGGGYFLCFFFACEACVMPKPEIRR